MDIQPDDSRIVYLNPRDLVPSTNNVRSSLGDLPLLAESIREHGLLQPIGVTGQNGSYHIVYGNRRREAAILVGLNRIPCVVLGPMDEERQLVCQVLENLQRLDLNDMDKATAFSRMLEPLRATGMKEADALDHIGQRVGLSPRQMQRYLALLELDAEVRELIASGEFGVTRAQHLRQVQPQHRQVELARLAVEHDISAGELARLGASLARNAGIDIEDAWSILRRGEEIADQTPKPKSEPIHLTHAPSAESEKDVEWDDESEDDGVESGNGRQSTTGRWQENGAAETLTRDGNRVRRFHSLDSMMDELDRLVAAMQDDRLPKILASDDAANTKLGLAARQARFLADALDALLRARIEA
jgi:ParB family transcriptional regulator, chromosome partitioning protein